MKIVVHKMHGCRLCRRCNKLLQHWNLPFKEVYDDPVQDRQYPYIEIEYEYGEIVELISMGVLHG